MAAFKSPSLLAPPPTPEPANTDGASSIASNLAVACLEVRDALNVAEREGKAGLSLSLSRQLGGLEGTKRRVLAEVEAGPWAA